MVNIASMEQQVLWRPDANFIKKSNLQRYTWWLEVTYGLKFKDYHELWAWSKDNLSLFWKSIWDYFAIKSYSEYSEVVQYKQMPDVSWFAGATLNYSEHIFRQRSPHRPALCFKSERHDLQIISWEELEWQVRAVATYMKNWGIGPGDRVVAYLPNIPQTIVCFLAANSLGAIWSCCSPDFGVPTVIDRFSQINPKIFIAVDGYQYGGKTFSRLSEVTLILEALPSIEQTIFIPYLNPDQPAPGQMCPWSSLINNSYADPLHFTPVSFDHPIWILFSSGTTGQPKAITHSHGGVLLEHLKYLTFHNDVHPGENFFWFSTTGWMMWNFLVGSLLAGSSAVLYDGSPGYPDLDVLWKLAEDVPIHHFGTSAPFLMACMKANLHPAEHHNLSALRSIGSTASPLPAEAFFYVYQHISSQVWLCSMSGGTDVCTAFVGGCPTLPVYPGHIQCRALGCDLHAYDEHGNEVTGKQGEMVLEKPLPSMPIYFWNDPTGQKYLGSYFEFYPGTWWHGDWITVYEDGSVTIEGRSDATLNRKGVRIGTAEIYAALSALPSVQDALILNLEQQNGDDYMPLFVVLNPAEQVLSAEIKTEILQHLRTQCSPRHVPDDIFVVKDIPYTLSGKKMEIPIKKILMGKEVSRIINKDAVKNPAALDFFLGFAKTWRT